MVDFTEAKPDEIIVPKYTSRPGFVEAPVRRGFTEIAHLWNFIVPMNAFICGGYIRYMCSPSPAPVPAGDIDIYFRDKPSFDLGKIKFGNAGFEIKHENDVSVSFNKTSNPDNPFFGSPQVQLIKPILEGAIVATGTMKEIIKNFDFTVIRCGLLTAVRALVDADFMHDEEKKILRIKNIHCPISSTLRCMKYSRKGYWLPPMQCCRLFIDWEERDEEYREKIIEFLKKSDMGEGLTKADIEEMEALMRID